MNALQLLGKQALVARTHEERAALDEVYTKLTEDELCAPVLDGGWSMKDVLVHIAAWERRVLNATAASARGEADVWPEPGATMADMDRLNKRDFLANRERTLADVLARARTTFGEFIRWVESFSPEEIASELPYTPGIKLESIIRGNADEHYREHLDAIEAWRAGQGA
jgi:hypothetical protein